LINWDWIIKLKINETSIKESIIKIKKIKIRVEISIRKNIKLKFLWEQKEKQNLYNKLDHQQQQQHMPL